MRIHKRLLLGLTLSALLAAGLSAQVIATGDGSVPAAAANPHLATATAGAALGIALPGAPHLLLVWNFAGVNFDRLQQHNGVSMQTGLEAWISPAAHPVQSHAPLLLGEALIGRRFGVGRHGFTGFGAGVGWSLGDWVPYVEFRRRDGFHSASPVDRQVVIGLHFVLFG